MRRIAETLASLNGNGVVHDAALAKELRAGEEPAMRIAINAISLRKGGVLVALDKLLQQFSRLKPNYEFHVVVGEPMPQLSQLDNPNVHYHRFRWADKDYARGGLWYLTVLPIWLRRQRIDVLFSQTCYLPPFRPRRTVLLVQDAKYFYKTPGLRNGTAARERAAFELKRLWTYYSVHVADHVLVQTRTLADSIIEKFPSVRSRLTVIPHGPGYLDGLERRDFRIAAPTEALEITYVALYRSYKNFSVLFDALQLLRKRGIRARLHLTLDTEAEAGAREVLECAARMGVGDMVVNHGELQPDDLSMLYRGSHVFVFPSVCESFGFPQVEAMSFGLPLLAADTPVNREICSYAARYFPPDGGERLAEQLERLYRNPEELATAGRLSLKRASEFDWLKAARDTLASMVDGHG